MRSTLRSMLVVVLTLAPALAMASPSLGAGSDAHPGRSARPGGATAAAAGDPVIMAAGDIACDPADPNFNGGKGTSLHCRQRSTSNPLVKKNPDAVLAVGDTQYECGGLRAYKESYDQSWGRVKSITHPVVGDNEYDTSGGTDCSSGAAGYFDYFGAAAGPRGKGYYSFDLGSWHLIALNSQCSHVGGCGPGSAQEQWLEADLASDTSECTLAYWHMPRWGTKPSNDNGILADLWEDLADADADVVVNGHLHTYARFTPLDDAGHPSAGGMREFIVGTGGEDAFDLAARPEIERGGGDFGVLRLVLHAHSYGWRFSPASGEDFTDSGNSSCH